MKGFFCLWPRLNAFVSYSKIKRFPLLYKSFLCNHENQLKVVRFQSSVRKTFDGPGLGDFIARDAIANSKELLNGEWEAVPYLNELDLHGRGRKVCFIVHGCQMNTSDIEIVWSILKKNGYERTTDEMEANVILIMTCAIRDSSEEKIFKQLTCFAGFKKNNPKKQLKIGILGCMAERLKEDILEKEKGVDLVAGPDSYKDLPRLLALTRNNQKAVNVLLSLDETYADVKPVKLNENDITAYVSIMRGCDNMCTYCIVPFTRGRERSRPIESIVDEVRRLSDQGIKQVTLLGQNVNSYRDVNTCDTVKTPSKLAAGFKTVYKPKLGGVRFDVLLDKISQINPNMRIRFTAPHPKDFPDEVLYLMRDRKNICSSLHLPAQSGSNAVLERMRRGHTVEAYLELVERIRTILPDIYFTTDIIIGFCGETEKDHEDTLELIRKVKYSFVFHYPYSMREKTTAYRRYKDDVPKEVKLRRDREVSELFKSVSLQLKKDLINKRQLVLIEAVSKKSQKFFYGRNDGNCSVFVPITDVPIAPGSADTKPVMVGDFIAVQITGASSHSLMAKPLFHTSLEEFNESLNVSNPSL